MKQSPKGAVFEKKEMIRCGYLQQALDRLNDEVGTYFKMLDEHNRKSSRTIGFWSSIRLLMPIIESIAHIVGENPQHFLGKELDIKTPYLVWDLFRHSLIHGDVLHHARYNGKNYTWAMGLNGMRHIIEEDHIGIDAKYLYECFKEYLEREIVKNDQSVIEFEVGVIYLNPKQEIIDDFSKL